MQLQLNKFQRFLKKIGLLVIKEKEVIKEVATGQCMPLCLENKRNGISYEVVGIDFEKGTLTLKFRGKTKENILVNFSDFEYERIGKSIYKFKIKQLCQNKERVQ